jgi:hypothetical protein
LIFNDTLKLKNSRDFSGILEKLENENGIPEKSKSREKRNPTIVVQIIKFYVGFQIQNNRKSFLKNL